MIRIQFNKKVINQLNYERYHHPHPKVQKKMSVLLLKSQGIPHAKIATIEGISGNTIFPFERSCLSLMLGVCYH